ncbi:MAG: hypothetical protein P9M03_06875 [Candidatus Theseobacter exili]|nr:hypothetical protein [Candidatus Theseobacter exili]
MAKIVQVCVSGGVADVSIIPPGIIVHVRDYDVEGSDDVETDENGDDYILSVYE